MSTFAHLITPQDDERTVITVARAWQLGVQARHRRQSREAERAAQAKEAKRLLNLRAKGPQYPWDLRHPEPATPPGSTRRLAGMGVGRG